MRGGDDRRDGDGTEHRPLAGREAWLITDGKTGMEVQVAGVARALGCAAAAKRVAPRGPWRWLAPWGPADPKERFAPPWPDIALATGRLSIPALRAVRKASPETFTVIIQNPRTGAGAADLIAVPEHDALAGDNVIRTLTAPHGFPPARLAALREDPPAEIAALPGTRASVILGGPNAAYRFSEIATERLARALASLAALGTSFLVTPSRRTPETVLAAVLEATKTAPRVLWSPQGELPYERFLAHGDLFVVTADSVNMTGEACASGRPVHVFEPDGGSAKFARFHAALRRYGATRPLPPEFSRLENWRYPPLDSAAEIAREIERRWTARQGHNP